MNTSSKKKFNKNLKNLSNTSIFMKRMTIIGNVKARKLNNNLSNKINKANKTNKANKKSKVKQGKVGQSSTHTCLFLPSLLLIKNYMQVKKSILRI